MTSNNKKDSKLKEFNFHSCLRLRFVLATLTGTPIKLSNIRPNEDDIGIREFEVNFIRLMDKITNGSKIEINPIGTTVYYIPGLLYGGKLEHECSLERSIGYYLEPLFILAPFCKKPLNISLYGITNDKVSHTTFINNVFFKIDPSVDSFKFGLLPLLKRFLSDHSDTELKIIKRGMPPLGGGHINFTCNLCRIVKHIEMTVPSKIKRIRGVAFGLKVSPSICNRMVESAKGIMLNFLPDVYIQTDHRKGINAGNSPVAETIDKQFFTAEAVSNTPGSSDGPSNAENIGELAAFRLLEEIYRGGCFDSSAQVLAMIFMAFGQPDVSKILSGPLSLYGIECLRLLKTFLNLVFKLEVWKPTGKDEELKLGASKVLLTCVGVGYSNLSKILI